MAAAMKRPTIQQAHAICDAVKARGVIVLTFSADNVAGASYGETKADGPVPSMNKTFTKAECETILQQSLTNKYDPEVRKCIHVPMPPHREAAILSFTFNLGAGPICNGPVGRYLNAGNVPAACNAMLAYDHAGGVRVVGLTRRRQAERELCLRDD